MPRREWPVAIAAFLLGLLVSGAAATTYVLLMTGGGGQTTIVPVDSTQVREREGGRGEIAVALRRIAQRLEAAKVPTERIRGEIGLRVANVVWTDGPRRAFLRAGRVNGRINVDAAEHGDIVLDNVSIVGANVYLDQPQPGGQWNYERVLADLLNDNSPSPGGPARTVLLRNVTIADSRAEVHQPARDLEFEDIDGRATRIQMSGPNVDDPELDIAHIDAIYEDIRKKQELPVTAENSHLRLPEGRVDFTVARATVAGTNLSDLEGRWQPGSGGLGLTIAGRATNVVFADLAFLSDRLPKDGGGSFRFAVRPLAGDELEVRLSDADVRAEGSHILGAVSLRTAGESIDLLSVDARLDPLALQFIERMSGRDLPYGGSLSGSVKGTAGSLNFNLVATLTAEGLSEPFTTDVTGLGRFNRGEFTLQRLTAKLNAVPAEALRPLVPGLPFRGAINGTVALNGPPDRAPLNLNIELNLAGGVANVMGTLDLTGSEPAYDLNGRLLGVSLQQLLEPQAPPALLTARFALRGRGADPRTADAQVNVTGRFTEWRAQPHDTVVIAAHVQNGSVAVDTGVVYLGPVHLETAGNWRFVAPESGALNYHAVIKDLAAVAPYVPALPDSATGALDGRGTINGSLERLRVDGTVHGDSVRIMHWTAGSFDVKHQAVLGAAVPEIIIEGTAKNIITPADGTYPTATLNLKLTPPAFALDVRAQRVQGGGLEIVADGTVPYQGVRHVTLHRAVVDADRGQWALTKPAAFDWGGPAGGLRVSNFEMRNTTSAGHISLDGRILPLAEIDARVAATALPIADVQRLLGREPIVSGLLTATGNVRGPGTAPTFAIEFQLDSGAFRNVPFTRVQGRADYAGQKLSTNAVATFDTAGTAELRASLPMNVALSPSIDFDLLDNGAVEGSLVADSVALAPIASFFPDLRDVQGWLRANAQFTGTVSNPQLTGSIIVQNGAALVAPLEQRYTDIHGEVVFNNRTAEIRGIHALSGGPADITGRIDFPELGNPQANITVTLDKFRPFGVDAHTDAATSGEVRVTGALLRPTVTGAVTISDGDVPVSLFAGGASFRTDLTDLTAADILEPAEPTGFFSGVTLDNFKLRVDRGTWFDLETSRAELAGELTINKQGDDMRITGTLEGSRGTYVLEAGPIVRSLDVTHAEVRFLGTTEINPAIDITARRVIFDAGGRQMDIEVRVGGTLRNPTLSLASADASAIPQDELLSFLLFGQSSLGLNSASLGLPGEALLQETLVGSLSELASLEIQNAIGAPFDVFQLRLGGTGFGGLESSALVMGTEVTRDVFLTVEYGIAALFGETGNSNSGTFAARLEWRVDRNTSVRLGYEPADRTRLFRGLGSLPISRPSQQGSLEIRRRWQW